MAPDLIAQMDADLSHDPAALPRLVAAARDADLVVGSRYVPGGGTDGLAALAAGHEPHGRHVRQRRAGVPVTRSDQRLQGLAAAPRWQSIAIDGLRSDGYAFTIEATWRALRQGARVVEVPIVFTDRVAGASKLSRRIVVEAALLVWKLRWEARSTRTNTNADPLR